MNNECLGFAADDCWTFSQSGNRPFGESISCWQLFAIAFWGFTDQFLQRNWEAVYIWWRASSGLLAFATAKHWRVEGVEQAQLPTLAVGGPPELIWTQGFWRQSRKLILVMIWLVVWLPWIPFFIFPYIGLLIIPTDFIFFRGVAQPPTRNSWPKGLMNWVGPTLSWFHLLLKWCKTVCNQQPRVNWSIHEHPGSTWPS